MRNILKKALDKCRNWKVWARTAWSIIWLALLRRYWSAVMNIIPNWQHGNMTIPHALSIEQVEAHMRGISYERDRWYDWVKLPAVTLITKRGDCEDNARLVAAIVNQEMDPTADMVNIICDDPADNHCVCRCPRLGGRFSNGSFVAGAIDPMGIATQWHGARAVVVEDPATGKPKEIIILCS